VNNELVDELKSELAAGNLQSATEIADSIKENGQKINHHGKRADGIVKGMLQHSRTSTGYKEPTDINALCDEYLRLAYHGIRAKDTSFNPTIKTDFDENIGNINIIPQEIGRVVLNLINNAFYAIDERVKQDSNAYDPTVTITTKKLGDKVLISIMDNGNGMPEKNQGQNLSTVFHHKANRAGNGIRFIISIRYRKSTWW
jgi:signal transduction histidine kinase